MGIVEPVLSIVEGHNPSYKKANPDYSCYEAK